jgi:hypothetical protein
MKEIVATPAIDKDGNEKELQFVFEQDAVDILYNGKLICGGDWTNNFEPLFARMLEVWKCYHVEENKN